LKNCNFNFDANNIDAPIAQITFLKKGDKQSIKYSVVDMKGKIIVAEQSFPYKMAEKAGIELAYRICGIGGKIETK